MNDFKCDNDNCAGWVCIYHGLRYEAKEHIDTLEVEIDDLIAAVVGMLDKWPPPEDVAKLEADLNKERESTKRISILYEQSQAENDALMEYFHAHIAVEAGLASFDLHNEAVDRLVRARDSVVALCIRSHGSCK